MTNFILLIIFGYLLGSIPSGYIISKAKGTDIRKVGSGNIGGTNVSRAFGLTWGIIVGVLDVLKGIIPVYLATMYLSSEWQIALVAAMPVIGHIFPVWLNFKGGKGVATTVGVLFILLTRQDFLIIILIWLLALLTVRIMSFASLTAASFVPLFFWHSTASPTYVILGIAFFSLIWWAHRDNIKRMKNNTEPKFKFKKTEEKPA